MLRIVRDEPAKPRRKGYRTPSPITKEIADRTRAVLRSLHLGHGAWSVVVELTGLCEGSLLGLVNGYRPITADALIRIAFAAGVSVDALLKQKLTDSGRCVHCGAKRAA